VEVRLAEKTHHLLITGTGRAGTSFLVQYLAELGLDTHLKRARETRQWDEIAQAGLEDLPLLQPSETLPYVIKTPWLTEYIDQILARDDLVIDVVVIPVRNLVEVASSRTVVEMQHVHATLPMTQLDKSWESWCFTPGGIVFSLNPLDQARLLALGFHQLVHHLTVADIPIVFLSFPRIVEDADYLFAKLRPYLSDDLSSEVARKTHQVVTDRGHPRMGSELSDAPASIERPVGQSLEYPSQDRLEGVALRRQVQRLVDELTALKAQLSGLAANLANADAELSRAKQDAKARDETLKKSTEKLRQLEEEAARKRPRIDRLLRLSAWRHARAKED
jgi:hypothetical protein